MQVLFIKQSFLTTPIIKIIVSPKSVSGKGNENV